jgi:hypothetical protein
MGLGTSSTFARPQLPELVTVARSVACNVEQQTIRWYGEFDPASPCPGPNVVNNPTECGWDIDDSWTKRGDGRLATGQVAQGSLCVVSDGTHRANVDASVRAKTDRLVVRLDASDGRAWVAVPVRDGNDFAYLACGDNYIPAPHPDLPGSNGGQGSIVTYTLTIDATERGGFVAAMLDYGSGFWTVGGC